MADRWRMRKLIRVSWQIRCVAVFILIGVCGIWELIFVGLAKAPSFRYVP